MNNITSSRFSKAPIFLITVLLVLAISQIGSYLVNTHLAIGETYVVNSFIHFTHIRNFGGVFGSFQGHSVIFALLSSLILLVCIVLFFKGPESKWYQSLLFGLSVGGGVSNILDRVLLGSVVDFINLQGIPHWSYIFNTADVFIHLGIWPSLLIGLLGAKTTPAAAIH